MSLPTAEQVAVAGRVANALARHLPASGVMDAADVRQMADEALVALVADGKAPDELAYLGRAIRNKMIDRLRVEGVLTRVRGGGPHRRPESPQEPAMLEQQHALEPGQEKIVRLTFEHDLTPAAIAEMTGRSVAAVYVKKGEALRALRGELLPRALEALVASANGLMVRETATEMGISTETVKTYRKQAIAALGARNTCHAVAIAFRRGLLA